MEAIPLSIMINKVHFKRLNRLLNHIGGIMLLRKSHNMKEKEQILVGSVSGHCDRVRRHVHPTIVSVSWHYNNPIKCVGLVQSGSNHHLFEIKFVLAMI